MLAMKGVANFKKLLAQLAPYQHGACFPPPATQKALRALQQGISYPLPPALIAIYGLCDGGPEVLGNRLAENLFYSYRFISVEKVLSTIAAWRDVRKSFAAGTSPREPIPSVPVGAVQDLYCGDDWIPFAADGAGGELAIDFAPGVNGVSGQIINCGSGDYAYFQLATDFDAFLERVVRDYELKRLHCVFGDDMLLPDRLFQQHRSSGGA
jgi:cell wall assembly regulator SMI1